MYQYSVEYLGCQKRRKEESLQILGVLFWGESFFFSTLGLIRILEASTQLSKYTGIYLGTPFPCHGLEIFSKYSWSLSDMGVNANMAESMLSADEKPFIKLIVSTL